MPAFVPLSRVMTRRNSDNSREMTLAAAVLIVESGPQLEQVRQEHILAGDLLQPRVLREQPLVVGTQGPVVDP